MYAWVSTWDDAGWYAGDEWKARKVEKVEKKAMGPDCSVKGKSDFARKGAARCAVFFFF